MTGFPRKILKPVNHPSQDRFDDLENLHNSDEYILNRTNESSGRVNVSVSDELFNSEEIFGLDEIAELISKGYDDIRASNPEIRSKEEQIDEIIAEVIRRKSYRAFEQLMSPFEGFKGIDLQIDVLLLAAKFIPFVPSLASNIQTWVTTNIKLSNDQFEICE